MPRSENGGRRDVTGRSQRVLYVEGATGLSDFAQLDPNVELVREMSVLGALARLENDGDFAVVVSDEAVDAGSGLELLARVRALSPTTVRLLIGEGAARASDSGVRELAFRRVSRADGPSELRRAIADGLAYHRLLATSPAQPVEVTRPEHDAMLPPANRERPRRASPSNAGPGAPPQFIRGALSIDLQSPELIVLDPAIRRVGLQVVGRFVELLPGLTIVGRSRTCHIPIPDAQISRRHAAFSNTGREVAVRNVSLTNGLRVNSVLIERDAPHALQVGDRVMIGSHEIELCALGDYCPSFEPTDVLLRDHVIEQPSLSTLLTLAQVAEKYFVLGQVREAERISRPVLEGLLRHCRAGRKPSKTDVELATDLTLRIAEANHAGEWIDYVFELFTLLERTLPAEVVERLYRLIPDSQGVKMSSYRAYLDTLGQLGDRLSPQERFLVRRIQGLTTGLMMSAHL
jgi:pSer/pThr/pTyr-binding forkhead associated (FHA) protein